MILDGSSLCPSGCLLFNATGRANESSGQSESFVAGDVKGGIQSWDGGKWAKAVVSTAVLKLVLRRKLTGIHVFTIFAIWKLIGETRGKEVEENEMQGGRKETGFGALLAHTNTDQLTIKLTVRRHYAMIASSSSAIQEEVPKSDAIEETSATGRGTVQENGEKADETDGDLVTRTPKVADCASR
ncbi:unnamed protein product [Enterobius vermicularis]|uniref:Uncharacterized protein n=1 Tax=Enterobius vermicularis TaxID=51028 RepID=A0A0N4VK94_ENTVE|nr:unnamed protein product [Enterobius vermicularis]